MSFIVKTNGAYLPAIVKDISQELNGMETATLILENNISTREFVAIDRPIEIYWGGTEVFTGTLQKVSYSEDGEPKLTCVAFDTVYDTLDKKTITATYDASDDSDDIESILAAIAAAAGVSSSCSLTGASYRRSLRFNKTSCYDAVQFLATTGNTDYYSSGSSTIVIGDRGTDRGTIPVLSISRSAVDRHVKRDKVEIRGFDANGNEITGSAGVGTNVVTYTEYKASDTTTLDQIAESKLDKLNKDSSGISIKVSTGYAYIYEPGDTVTLSKDSLNLSGSYKIWKITKREDVCNVEIDVPEALLETYLSKQKQLEDLGIYTGAALLDLPVGPPAAPATPTVTGMIDGIQLSWAANAEADMNHYDVYRNTTSASGTASKLGEVAGTILTDPNKNYNQYYYYWLKAVDNTDHTSGFGSVASGKSRRASGVNIAPSSIDTTHLSDNAITGPKIEGSAISTAHLQDLLITNAKILNGAVSELKIAASSVSANKIATNAIVERTIAAGQITTTKIANDSITSALIAASTIVSANIMAGGILATNIGADQITSTHIAASTITSANIIAGGIAAINIAASSITSNKIYAGAIITSKLAADAVTANEIAASSIYANALQAKAVNATHIAASSIYTNALQTDAVTARTIAGSTITANLIGADAILAVHIAASSIYTNALQANSITLGKMGTGSVDGTKITASSIATNHILTDAITSRVIAAGAIIAAKIGADEVNATHIAASSVYTNSLQAGSITLGKMGANSVDGTKITASSIATNHIQSDAVTARVIAGSAIVANLIAADAILAIHIAASSIYTNALQAGSITLGKMGSNSVDGTKITASSIQSKHFTADSVTALHIAASSIYTNSLQAGSITLGKLGSNSVDSTKITASSINTNHITTDAITARVIAGSAIVSNLIAADAVLAVNIFAGAVTSDKITSNNIYGKRFATSSGVGRAGGATGIRFFDSGIIFYGGGTTKKIELSTAVGARPRMTLYGSGVLDFYSTAGGTQDGLIGHGGYTYGSGIEIYAPVSKIISLNGGGGGLYIAKGGNIIPRAPIYGASYGISGNTGTFTTIRAGNIYATSISGSSITTHFRDAYWGDLLCPICDEPFKPGDTLGIYVKAIEHSEIRTVPAHLHDFRKL